MSCFTNVKCSVLQYRGRTFDYKSDSNNNLSALINKSKALEEEIFSEVFGFGSSVEQYKQTRGRTLSKITSSSSQSSRMEYASFKHFNSPAGIKKFSYPFGNETVIHQNGYFLGFGGHPFSDIRFKKINYFRKSRSGKCSDPRQKRSVFHLYNMVLCATGCNPLSYKGYGCYCGFLGSGYPVDEPSGFMHFTCSCCRMHDRCYTTAGCPMFFEYFVPYFWKCYADQPICAIDHGPYGGPGSCAQRLCECDKQLTLCLKRYPCPPGKALCTTSPFRFLQNVLTP
ncbi:hypothetical protein RUM43_000077 [Polyplax serrata]|uniref:Phospholipase A2 n=1 Tax=Polyplax serrata TaxID=468196 RepID=A0AAN8SCV9_POLSC